MELGEKATNGVEMRRRSRREPAPGVVEQDERALGPRRIWHGLDVVQNRGRVDELDGGLEFGERGESAG